MLGYRFASEGVVHEVARLCAKEEVSVPAEAVDALGAQRALLERARTLQVTARHYSTNPP